MHQFLPLHSYWTCLSPEGFLPPSKPARYQLAFVKKKKRGGKTPQVKVSTGHMPKTIFAALTEYF